MKITHFKRENKFGYVNEILSKQKVILFICMTIIVILIEAEKQ